MKITVTGSDGFLGRHLRVRLRAVAPDATVAQAPRGVFDDDDLLAGALTGSDAVVHLAGVNRGDAADVEEGNLRLAVRLGRMLERAGGAPRLVYANSIQSGALTPYGQGKVAAATVLERWAERAGASYVNVMLPNVFGEGGRPDYNSFVATFCHRLATGNPAAVGTDRELQLLHAQDAAATLIAHLAPDAPAGSHFPAGTATSVKEILARLEGIAVPYRRGCFPDLGDPLTLRLFNTYRSYLHPHGFPIVLTTHHDRRGTFVETTQALGGQSQSSFSTTEPGVTRGNHFHLRKVERFVVVSGQARVNIRAALGGPVASYALSGDRPAIVDMPTLHTHNITNVGDDILHTVFWISEIYDPADPDTFHQDVA